MNYFGLPFPLLINELGSSGLELLFSLSCGLYNLIPVVLIRVKLRKYLLVKPWCVDFKQLSFQKLPEKPLLLQYHAGVLLQVLQILLGKDPAYQLFLCESLLLIWFLILQIPPLRLLLNPELLSLQFLNLR